MATPTLDQDIQSRIQSFLGELSELVRRSALEAVQIALSGDGAAPRRRGPGRPRGSGKRGPGRTPKAAAAKPSRRGRRSSEDLDAIAARVLAHVKSNPGARLEEIGRGLKTDTGILKRPVAKLLEAKQLRTEGQKRGTKYFAGGRGAARKAKASKTRKPTKRGGRKAKSARKASSKRSMRRTAKAKTATPAPTAAAA